jgi:serine-type D-Ala-D-Ala carboxypeptidase/endopeptidase (penicillin-binding protein 4)
MRTFFLFVLIFGNFAFARSSQTKIESLIKAAKVPIAEFGLYISSNSQAKVDEAEVDVNSKKLMIPASISKVATAAAALGLFKESPLIQTTLWADEKNLYLKGGGDPAFVSENMWFLVNQFLRSNRKTISGDIVVDDSYFDLIRYDESREDVRVDRAYDAPVGAMSFNWNSANIFIRPSKIGEPANVIIDPENNYIRLVNKTKTTSGALQSIQVDRQKKSDHEVFTVTGQIGVLQKEMVIYKNITQPDLWSGENLKSFLAQRGISVLGKVRTGRVPVDAKEVARYEAKSIEHILSDMNKFSNNFVAEMITKNISSLSGAKPGSLQNGVEQINTYLQKTVGLASTDYVFENPSGLTRENKFSARAMWQILSFVQNDFRYSPEFFVSLPIAGRDGTLKRRMKNTKTQDWVRAKTGMLSGVTTLAGYAGKADQKLYTFVFIHNGTRDESRIRSLFDDFLIALLDNE